MKELTGEEILKRFDKLMEHHIDTTEGIKAQCYVCHKTEPMGHKNLKSWEVQHLHFSDAEIEVLTCDECKKLAASVILDLYLAKGKRHE